MRQFTDELEARLHAAAETEAARGPAARAARSIAAAPKPVGGITALAVTATVAIVVATGSGGGTQIAQAFPILDRPAVDASHRAGLGVLRSAGADLKQTRAFATPYGPGYVAEAPGDRLCLVIPDKDAGGAMAGTCQPTATAEARGLVATLIGTGGQGGGSEFVAVLPTGATAHVVTRGGSGPSKSLAVTDGVVAARFSEDVDVAITVNGQSTVTKVPLIVNPGKGGLFDCGRGGPVIRATSRQDACGTKHK